jgi:hypothetical protein
MGGESVSLLSTKKVIARMKKKAPMPAPPAKKVGRTQAEFRALHDKGFIIPSRMRAGIKALGPDGWEYEAEFMKLADISTTDLGMYRDQFADYQAVATTTKSSGGGVRKKIIWCGSVAFAKKLGGPRIIDAPVE